MSAHSHDRQIRECWSDTGLAKMFGGASTAISAVGLEGAASTAARALARTLPIGIGDGEGPDTHVPAA